MSLRRKRLPAVIKAAVQGEEGRWRKGRWQSGSSVTATRREPLVQLSGLFRTTARRSLRSVGYYYAREKKTVRAEEPHTVLLHDCQHSCSLDPHRPSPALMRPPSDYAKWGAAPIR